MDPRIPAAALAALLFATATAVAQQPVVRGEPALAPKASAPARVRLEPAQAASARLPALTDEELESVRARNRVDGKQAPASRPRRVTVGLARPLIGTFLTADALKWHAVAGGNAAQVALTSPDAGSLRLAIDLAGVPADVEMVFFGSAAPARLEGPVRVGDIPNRTVPWWSPLTEGETQTVEFFVPARHEPGRLRLGVAGASHVFTTPSSRFTKRLQDIGLAGSCNVDIPCSPLASDASFRNIAESTAQMVFNDAGFTTLCTATLLADSDPSSQVPWLFGANHCFENDFAPYKTTAQMQVVADTVTTLWGFEASACSSRTPRTGWSQVGGGATLIHHNAQNDVMLLRLNAAPPSGSFYSGWDANPIGTNAAVASIHHPQGDLKKVTQGSVVRFSTPGVGGGTASFIETLWSSGTTEAGSSGGGLWTTSGGQYLFRGGLWGGSALCSNPTGTDHFSRLDIAYPALAAYLGSGTGPAIDYTDLWWNPNESGWGLNLIQHPSRIIFGVWYTYELDGTRTWFVIPTGSWSNATTYAGPLYATAGPPYTAPFNPDLVEARQVGSATLTFTDANNGRFDYSVDGMSGSKAITRQPF